MLRDARRYLQFAGSLFCALGALVSTPPSAHACDSFVYRDAEGRVYWVKRYDILDEADGIWILEPPGIPARALVHEHFPGNGDPAEWTPKSWTLTTAAFGRRFTGGGRNPGLDVESLVSHEAIGQGATGRERRVITNRDVPFRLLADAQDVPTAVRILRAQAVYQAFKPTHWAIMDRQGRFAVADPDKKTININYADPSGLGAIANSSWEVTMSTQLHHPDADEQRINVIESIANTHVRSGQAVPYLFGQMPRLGLAAPWDKSWFIVHEIGPTPNDDNLFFATTRDARIRRVNVGALLQFAGARTMMIDMHSVQGRALPDGTIDVTQEAQPYSLARDLRILENSAVVQGAAREHEGLGQLMLNEMDRRAKLDCPAFSK